MHAAMRLPFWAWWNASIARSRFRQHGTGTFRPCLLLLTRRRHLRRRGRRSRDNAVRTVQKLDWLQGKKFIVNFFELSRTLEAEMNTHFNGLSPGESADPERELQEVIAFWNELSCCADAGETTWGVLEELQGQVTDCLRSCA